QIDVPNVDIFFSDVRFGKGSRRSLSEAAGHHVVVSEYGTCRKEDGTFAKLIDRRTSHFCRQVSGSYHHGGAPIGQNVAFPFVERVGDHGRGEYFFYGRDFFVEEYGVWVECGPLSQRYHDGGHVLRRGSRLMHVTAGHHGDHGVVRRSERV